MTGYFVAFEGGEACGKSTQARLLAEALGAVLTREPGGTVVGERLRSLLLDPATGDLDARTEALLMIAARAEHTARVIEPALRAGRHVVSDRFSGSTLAYQGYGRGLPVAELAQVSTWATAGREPDLVVLLEVTPEVAASRLGGVLDRLESAGAAFHDAVQEGFRALAAADPDRWLVLDGSAPVAEVAAVVRAAVVSRLGLQGSLDG